MRRWGRPAARGTAARGIALGVYVCLACDSRVLPAARPTLPPASDSLSTPQAGAYVGRHAMSARDGSPRHVLGRPDRLGSSSLAYGRAVRRPLDLRSMRRRDATVPGRPLPAPACRRPGDHREPCATVPGLQRHQVVLLARPRLPPATVGIQQPGSRCRHPRGRTAMADQTARPTRDHRADMGRGGRRAWSLGIPAPRGRLPEVARRLASAPCLTSTRPSTSYSPAWTAFASLAGTRWDAVPLSQNREPASPAPPGPN